MFRGFDVKIATYDEYHYRKGLEIFSSNEAKVTETLQQFIGIDGVINGSDLQNNWFKNINSHIFISHSHQDKELAIALAGYLYEKFELLCFVDSCVWGYCDKLLKQLDNKYCRNDDGKSYNYELRNFSTTHVHMMLSTALNMMIDKSESIFFINTPNSLISSEITAHTYSPWIYSELSTSKIIRKITPKRHLISENRTFSTKEELENLNESLKIKYRVDLREYVELSETEIIEWAENKVATPEEALDNLYEKKPPKRRLTI
jgi:hypothetical protein